MQGSKALHEFGPGIRAGSHVVGIGVVTKGNDPLKRHREMFYHCHDMYRSTFLFTLLEGFLRRSHRTKFCCREPEQRETECIWFSEAQSGLCLWPALRPGRTIHPAPGVPRE